MQHQEETYQASKEMPLCIAKKRIECNHQLCNNAQCIYFAFQQARLWFGHQTAPQDRKPFAFHTIRTYTYHSISRCYDSGKIIDITSKVTHQSLSCTLKTHGSYTPVMGSGRKKNQCCNLLNQTSAAWNKNIQAKADKIFNFRRPFRIANATPKAIVLQV
ncbi:hypothetical protein GOBAR_AA20588 [Gossypium barbadense]|uniref:Uncharacterized protein n=1 Tax=Gossypium barbadense TaxID=3634 RepID=A0A2P5X9S3_GOSBA|nr:hypothetical protein GOBAR_AA20588 [Gossypium barbadense]